MPTNSKKYLIFDFDGVLGDTFETVVRARMENENLDREATVRNILNYAEKPSHAREHNLSDDKIAEINTWTENFGLKVREVGFELFTGFIDEIKKIKELNPEIKFAVVSSGSSIYINPKLAETGLDFSHVLTFENHHSKEEKVEEICEDWGITPSEVCYFTDTKTDVLELQKIMGLGQIIGCSWGYHSFEKLKEVLPENQILREFGDIRKVVWGNDSEKV